MYRSGLAWLELLLVLAMTSLLLQLFPAAGSWILGAIDAREWNRITWFLVNVLFVFLFVGIRAMPEIKVGLARKRERTAIRRKREQRTQAALDRKARLSRRIR